MRRPRRRARPRLLSWAGPAGCRAVPALVLVSRKGGRSGARPVTVDDGHRKARPEADSEPRQGRRGATSDGARRAGRRGCGRGGAAGPGRPGAINARCMPSHRHSLGSRPGGRAAPGRTRCGPGAEALQRAAPFSRTTPPCPSHPPTTRPPAAPAGRPPCVPQTPPPPRARHPFARRRRVRHFRQLRRSRGRGPARLRQRGTGSRLRARAGREGVRERSEGGREGG